MIVAILSACARPAATIGGSQPIDAYVLLGSRIKTCWFNADHPLLPHYVYQAEVAPDGSKVQISIHDRIALGRPGYTDYLIDFKSDGGRTMVDPTNLKMPANLAAKMKYDLDRWQRGEANCNNTMPKPTLADAPGAASSTPPQAAKGQPGGL
jgi:hypothetical protein